MARTSEGKIVERLHRQRDDLLKTAEEVRIKLEAIEEALGIRDRKMVERASVVADEPMNLGRTKPHGFKLIPEIVTLIQGSSSKALTVPEIAEGIETKWGYKPDVATVRSTVKYVDGRGGPLVRGDDGLVRLRE